MPFTEKEKRQWLDQKRARENAGRRSVGNGSRPGAECLHCGSPFGISEGVITDEVALCDVCNGD